MHEWIHLLSLNKEFQEFLCALCDKILKAEENYSFSNYGKATLKSEPTKFIFVLSPVVDPDFR